MSKSKQPFSRISSLTDYCCRTLSVLICFCLFCCICFCFFLSSVCSCLFCLLLSVFFSCSYLYLFTLLCFFLIIWFPLCYFPFLFVFKALALWADAFYKLKCPSVCVSVCLSECSLLSYRLNVFLPPLPKVRCPIFLEIRNPWGKVMERSGLRFEHFCLEVV